MSERKIEELTAVCIGRRIINEKTVVQSWQRLTSDGKLTEGLAHRISMDGGVKGAKPGMVYRLRYEGDSYFVRGSAEVAPQFLRLWREPGDRAGWDAADEAAVAEDRARKRTGQPDPFDTLIAPLVAAYLKTDQIGRRHFVARVLERLIRASIVGR